MTVSHQIEKQFRNDCAPPHLEMTVLHHSLEMTVFHQIEKWLCSMELRKVLEMTVFHLII